MKRSTIAGAWLVSAAMILMACGGSASTDNRIRNIVGSDGYEVPRVHTYEYVDAFDRTASREWGAGYTTAGPEKWDPATYDTGQGRARAASPVYEEVGPRVPPRSNRPGSAAPPIYERPVSGKLSARAGTTAPKVSSGAAMNTKMFGKVLGGLGNMGAMMAGSIAMAGVGMALQALGAPPFLMALFGGPDEATMAALQAIMKTLEEMNKKLDEINGKLDELQISVNDLGAAVQALAGSVCDESVTQSINAINDIVDPIDTQWMHIYMDNKLLVGDMKTNTFTPQQLEYFDMSQAAVTKLDPLSMIDKIEAKTLGSAALSGATGAQSGLLSQVQKCTMVRSRFLTNADTSRWQSLVLLLMMSQAKAAELATWNEIYTAMKEKRSPNITQLNLINLQLRHSMSAMGFNVSMQIPEGQVLDTVTNKMWRMAPSGTSKVGLQEALTACLPDEERFANYAPVPSWNGMGTRDLNMCVSTRAEALKTANGRPTGSPLDLGAGAGYSRGTLPEGDWRIPTLGEISTYGGDANNTAAPGTVGLLDYGINSATGEFKRWKDSKCGNARATACSTPAEYLATFGFTSIPNDLGVVWSNSTLSQFGKGGYNEIARAAWNAEQARYSYNHNWSPAGTGIYGFCEDEVQMRMTNNSAMCPNNALFPWMVARSSVAGIPLGYPTLMNRAYALDNFCFRFTTTVWKSGHTKGEWFSPVTPEVAAVNFGAEQSAYVDPVFSILRDDAKPWKDTKYGTIKAGEYGSKFASRTLSNATIACAHDWYMPTVAKLPQTAQAMWVRNLDPNESYYSVASAQTTSTVAQLRSFQSALQPASVSMMSMNGQAVIHSRFPKNASGTYFVKCLVNPDEDPLTAQDVIDKGTDCPQLSFALSDGLYRVYAATTRTVDGKPVLSNLEIADLGISSKFADIPGLVPTTVTPTSTSLPEGLVTTRAVNNSAASSSSPWANTPAMATTAGVFDVGMLLAKAKVKLKAGEKVAVKVDAKSKGICSYVKPTLSGLRAGTCTVSITVTTKKGKKSTKKLTIPVS